MALWGGRGYDQDRAIICVAIVRLEYTLIFKSRNIY